MRTFTQRLKVALRRQYFNFKFYRQETGDIYGGVRIFQALEYLAQRESRG